MTRALEVEHLYVSDDEIRQRLGVGEDTLRVAIKQLERNGFPKKDPLFGKKRYWPAVQAFLDRRSGLSMKSPSVVDGQENVNGSSKDRQRTGARVASAR